MSSSHIILCANSRVILTVTYGESYTHFTACREFTASNIDIEPAHCTNGLVMSQSSLTLSYDM